jgi:hypothetical protein
VAGSALERRHDSQGDIAMNLRHHVRSLVLLTVLGASLAAAAAQAAPQVWSGRTFAFSKAAGANPALAVNQDRIRSNVWITRGSTQGIYNAFSEAGYAHTLSPAGTTWATGDAVNWPSLTFTDWENWAGGFPPGAVGVNAVVHLVADDIYLDIVFDTWGVGVGGGGAFSYHRAVEPQGTPVEKTTWGAIKSLYR